MAAVLPGRYTAWTDEDYDLPKIQRLLEAAEDRRFELLRVCPQHAFQQC